MGKTRRKGLGKTRRKGSSKNGVVKAAVGSVAVIATAIVLVIAACSYLQGNPNFSASPFPSMSPLFSPSFGGAAGGGSGAGVEQTGHINIQVNYADGTSSLSLVDASGKSVVSLTASLFIAPSFTGTVNSYSVSGVFQSQLLSSSQSVLASVGSNSSISKSGLSLSSGVQVSVFQKTITVSDIMASYSGWVHGTTCYLRLQLVSGLNVSLTFNDGTQTKFGSVLPLLWQFTYNTDNTFTSVGVSWGTS